jgi:DNA adenine methylase
VPSLAFLKWPGGKRWFISGYATVLPTTFGRYFEPFLGGASVFFYLQPEQAVLGDTNADLIELFKVMAWKRKRLERLLRKHQEGHGKRYYYRVRDTIPTDRVEQAARTLYLNRTCFNGIYRVNHAGQFNVPKGVRKTIVRETDDFATAARLLRRVELRVSDFEMLIDEAQRGDLVFADPPYIVGHNNNGFVKYNEKLFKWEDQVRLAKALHRAWDRGVKVVATNACHPAIEKLYPQPSFSLRRVKRYSSISADAEGRCQFQELIITANCD